MTGPATAGTDWLKSFMTYQWLTMLLRNWESHNHQVKTVYQSRLRTQLGEMGQHLQVTNRAPVDRNIWGWGWLIFSTVYGTTGRKLRWLHRANWGNGACQHVPRWRTPMRGISILLALCVLKYHQTSNIRYTKYPKIKCFLAGLADVFLQYIEARC